MRPAQIGEAARGQKGRQSGHIRIRQRPELPVTGNQGGGCQCVGGIILNKVQSRCQFKHMPAKSGIVKIHHMHAIALNEQVLGDEVSVNQAVVVC